MPSEEINNQRDENTLQLFQGVDCSKSVCPVLCSSHGQYGGGMCHCEEGWKGAECDIPLGDCQVPDCNQHGQCVRGSCVCNPGWKGAFCDERKLTRSNQAMRLGRYLISTSRVIDKFKRGSRTFSSKLNLHFLHTSEEK